jgi:hypothetical protein
MHNRTLHFGSTLSSTVAILTTETSLYKVDELISDYVPEDNTPIIPNLQGDSLGDAPN